MKSTIWLGLAASVCLVSALPAAEGTVGRVRVSTVREEDTAREAAVTQRLSARFAPAADRRYADVRIVSLRPRSGDPRFDVTVYDYAVERTFELVVDPEGKELERRPVPGQPALTLAELDDAAAIVRESEAFKDAIGIGALELYEAMPPVTVDAEGRRRINVGVMSPPSNGYTVERNEVVSVHIPTGTLLRHASGAPDTSRALTLACGPASAGCGAAVGTCNYYQIVWPASDPVWKLNVRHPKCTESVQSEGTGLELTDVYYRNRLILKRAEVPVLNVLYEGNTCGPYRDWLDSEDCMQAPGTDVPAAGSGIRVASSLPSTFCETFNDSGNFKGVAIYDQGDSLWLLAETNAGWYRYIMEWRLHLDGTIEPIFGFGATSNSCTCNAHDHHAYWRFEWAVDAVSDGTTDDPATGVNTVERRRPGTTDTYDPITTEGTFVRDPAGWDKDYWRIKNPLTGNGYVIQPGGFDGHASGDAYAKLDFAALALNPNEINDPNTNTSINIAPWDNDEPLGASKRLVTWYHTTYLHDDPGGTGEACELAGPRLVPLTPCAGTVTLDRGAYGCQSSVGVSVTDADLSGTGTLDVQIVSGTEAAPETVSLVESPVSSGRFAGSILASADPPATGDGKVSVADGDTIDVRYVDASSCGAPNVVIEKTAPVDCLAPVISNLQATPGDGSATILWNTGEAASSVVHFGTSVPTAGTVTQTAPVSAHAIPLTGLAQCTTYYYWVESADAAGNVASSHAGGGYLAFTTPSTSLANVSSADTPIAIPDNNSTGATSTIAVGQTGTVQDVNVTVNVTHPYVGDLTLSLISPTNATVTLSQRRGGSGDNYASTVFDDEATTPISLGSPPYAGSFRPETLLSAAEGIQATGSWRLRVQDLAGQDLGTIDSWLLRLTLPPGSCPPSAPPPPVDAMTVDPVAGGVHLSWGAGACPAPNYHLLYGPLEALPTYALGGSVCGLGPTGSYDWTSLPAGDLWFVVVADDAAGFEGSWGLATGGDRNGAIVSGACGFAQRSNAGTCP